MVYDALHNNRSTALGLTEKESGIELPGLKDSFEEHDTDLGWCHSDIRMENGAGLHARVSKETITYRSDSLRRHV